MKPRINSIFRVDCKAHNGKPIQTCDEVNDLKLLCSDCHNQGKQITLEHISEDILSFYKMAKSLREQRLQQLELTIVQINAHFQQLLDKINKDLKIIKQSLVNLRYFEYIEQQWINDITNCVSVEDLTKLVKVWSDVYLWDGNQSKLKDSLKTNMLDKIQKFYDKLKSINPEFYKEQNPQFVPVPSAIPKPIVIDRLLVLEKEPKKIAMYEVCHFKVLQSCRLKQFLMPPVIEDVILTFGFHKKIDQQPSKIQELTIQKHKEPKFYSISDVAMEKDQLYTLSLQFYDESKRDFKIQRYIQNAPKNEYLEFIDDPQIYNSWGKSNQFYNVKGLFSSLIIE